MCKLTAWREQKKKKRDRTGRLILCLLEYRTFICDLSRKMSVVLPTMGKVVWQRVLTLTLLDNISPSIPVTYFVIIFCAKLSSVFLQCEKTMLTSTCFPTFLSCLHAKFYTALGRLRKGNNSTITTWQCFALM